MPSFKVEFEVFCAKCGAGLCNNSKGSLTKQGNRVDVYPCKRCLDDSYLQGRSDEADEADQC
jgi:hypothetical protein